MTEFRSLVVGVDFTRQSQNALREAIRLAAADATVHVVHVLGEQAVDDVHQAMDGSGSVEDQLRDEARTRLDEMISELGPLNGSASASVQAEVLLGNPAQVLLDRSSQLGADMLVLARNSTSDPKAGAGSYAVRCVRHASMDVLLVRAEHAGPFRRIAACVDFSSNSEQAASLAALIAHRDGAHLDLLHAFLPPWEAVPFAAMPVAASASFQTDYLSMLQRRMDSLRSSLVATYPDLRIAQQIEPAGSAGSALVAIMEETGADLAVLGSHGRGRIERMLLGSTAERVIRSAHCSVLTVK